MLVRIHSVLTPEQRRGLDAILNATRRNGIRNNPRLFFFNGVRCWEKISYGCVVRRVRSPLRSDNPVRLAREAR
jgi:hypothetical protein